MKFSEYTQETKMLMSNFDRLIDCVDSYVEMDEDLTDDQVDDINYSIRAVKGAIIELQMLRTEYDNLNQRYQLCDQERQANAKAFVEECKKMNEERKKVNSFIEELNEKGYYQINKELEESKKFIEEEKKRLGLEEENG